MSMLARILLTLIGLLVAGQVAQRAARHWVPALAAVRPRWPAMPRLSAGAYTPDRLLSHVPLEPGMRVLYVGPADGSLLAAVARAAGKYGRVYAVESSPERARRLDFGRASAARQWSASPRRNWPSSSSRAERSIH